MVLAAIDESHRGTCDFLYLPIDFQVILFEQIFSNRMQSLAYSHLGAVKCACV